MVNNPDARGVDEEQLDLLFGALADGHRREILTRLSTGPKTVTQLATGLPISLPATSKHLRLLEAAGLLTRTVEGRIRRCTMNSEAFETAQEWILRQRRQWDTRLDALERYLEATDREPMEQINQVEPI